MSNLVGNPNCWFSDVKAQMGMNPNESNLGEF